MCLCLRKKRHIEKRKMSANKSMCSKRTTWIVKTLFVYVCSFRFASVHSTNVCQRFDVENHRATLSLSLSVSPMYVYAICRVFKSFSKLIGILLLYFRVSNVCQIKVLVSALCLVYLRCYNHRLCIRLYHLILCQALICEIIIICIFHPAHHQFFN